MVYLLSYSGATLPSLVSGRLSSTFSLPQIALGYGALALAATLFTVVAARDPHTDATTPRGQAEARAAREPTIGFDGGRTEP